MWRFEWPQIVYKYVVFLPVLDVENRENCHTHAVVFVESCGWTQVSN